MSPQRRQVRVSTYVSASTEVGAEV
jgi:hypothetical protein